MKLCCIIATEGFVGGVVSFVPFEHFALFEERKSQIALGELLAFMLAFKWYPERLREKSIAAYIENMGVLHSIINSAPQEPRPKHTRARLLFKDCAVKEPIVARTCAICVKRH